MQFDVALPTIRDRVVQTAAKLVLEPIFEADFHPSSYGFRPRRRAWDAVAEVQMFASRSYEWVLEGDITACFDEIDHTALMGRVRQRIGDKRVLALVKAFLKAGILSEDQVHRESNSGTPQGGILSPLLANIALEVLDEHFARVWATISPTRVDRSRRRRHGLPVYRLVRYADDFVVMCRTRAQANEALRRLRIIMERLRLTLHPDKTRIVGNTFVGDDSGIRMDVDSRNGVIEQNTFEGAGIGVDLRIAPGVSITGNHFTGGGVGVRVVFVSLTGRRLSEAEMADAKR